jgi:murein DD-endopeptidase MepM/ murein hydrolase activator NlpD
MHPIYHVPLPHEGVDVTAPKGTSIWAAAKGTVVFAGRRAGYGLAVEVNHGYGYRTFYAHASKLLVRKGQKVNRGDMIARVGSTGLSTYYHLHYEVRLDGRPVDPLQYIITGALP